MTDEQIYMSTLLQEIVCPICKDIPLNPVRFRVIENKENSTSVCTSVCNDVFCETCIIKFIYHYQRRQPQSVLKCPICSQKVAYSCLESYIEDKITKKIVLKYLDKFPEKGNYLCKYECGFKGVNYHEILDHYKRKGIVCCNKILKCESQYCFYLGKYGKELYDHYKNCPCRNITCPLCTKVVNNNRVEFTKHIKEYHKILNFLNLDEQKQEENNLNGIFNIEFRTS